MRFPCLLSILISLSLNINAQSTAKTYNAKAEQVWVDSVFKTMSLEQKIGQLFMVRAQSNLGPEHMDMLTKLVKDQHIGGICFFKGTPYKQAVMTNQLQALATIPLLISIDGEWGVSMRLDSALIFPRQMTMGALKDDDLVYAFGREVAKQCKCLGIQFNFAPSIDINSNPRNPVINSRAFGEDIINVSKKGTAYMNGMQDMGVLACAKHFPGHGDTDQDSHYTLPVIKLSKQSIDSIHLTPFKYLFEQGVKSVMVGHLHIPALDTIPGISSSMSKKVINELLRGQLGFNGLVVSDALDMKGVSDFYAPGDLEYKALLAGNDILLLPVDVPCAIETIKLALDRHEIQLTHIDSSVKKILAAKYWSGLATLKPIDLSKLNSCMYEQNAIEIKEKIYENAITLVRNNKNILPLQRLDTLRIACINIGTDSISAFQTSLSRFTQVKHFNMGRDSAMRNGLKILDSLADYNLVIVSIQNTNELAKYNYGIRKTAVEFITILKAKKKVILDVFANPYALSLFSNNLQGIEAILVSYHRDVVAQKKSAGIIFGEYAAKGILPVTAANGFPLNAGMQSSPLNRMSVPEEGTFAVNSEKLSQVDSIAKAGVLLGAYPGCVVLAAQKGNIFYHKAFGYHQFDSLQQVQTSDLYDLASLTKVLATTLAVMKLYEQGKIKLDALLGDYLPELKGTNKEDLIIRDVLTHQAGLEPWISFYSETIKESAFDTIYKRVMTKGYVRVADSLYIKESYKKQIMQTIIDSKLNKKKKYKYSDLGFYLMREVVERTAQMPIDKYLQDNFYTPLELSTMGYRPLNRFDKSRIVPTENDDSYRKQLIHGDVHDQGAAMLGGISGHAGLFADAYDVAVIMQMWLQGGTYLGKQLLKQTTIDEFAKAQFPELGNRRGLGFDKPLINGHGGPTCDLVSKNSFGHTGFTGVYAWADPENELVYVFLSNRIHPKADNNKLLKLNIRTEIQLKLYESIK